MQNYVSPSFYAQPQMMPMQQPQLQSQNGTRFVQSFDEIRISDVPMDGKYALFAKADMSEIQARAWTPQGLITTLEYSLKQPTVSEKKNELPQIDLSLQFEPILAEIKALNDKIDKLNRPNKRKDNDYDKSANDGATNIK